MNNHLTMNDLLDLWVKNEITMDELAIRSGNKDLFELQEKMEMHQVAVRAIQKHATARQVASVHREYLGRRRDQNKVLAKLVSIQRTKLIVRIASVAAVFAAILVIAQMVFISSNRIYSESFSQYYVNNERSAEAPATGNVTALFQKGDYAGVISAFKSQSSHENKELFLAGYSSLMMKDYKNASGYFTAIMDNFSKNGNRLFMDEAEYYLALTDLRQGKNEEAYLLMSKIYSNPDHTYHDAFDKWTMWRMKWIK